MNTPHPIESKPDRQGGMKAALSAVILLGIGGCYTLMHNTLNGEKNAPKHVGMVDNDPTPQAEFNAHLAQIQELTVDLHIHKQTPESAYSELVLLHQRLTSLHQFVEELRTKNIKIADPSFSSASSEFCEEIGLLGALAQHKVPQGRALAEECKNLHDELLNLRDLQAPTPWLEEQIQGIRDVLRPMMQKRPKN